MQSIKMITSRLLQGLPTAPELLHNLREENALFVPGELGPLVFTTNMTLLVCGGNGVNARSVAEELQQASNTSHRNYSAGLTVQSAFGVLREQSQSTSPCETLLRTATPTFMLLYLNEDIFTDGSENIDGSVANLVCNFMEQVVCHLFHRFDL